MTAQWSRSEFARIARDVETRTGIVFPANRIASAESGMKRVMSNLRIADPVSLELAVSKPGPIREALMAELTIGESYFFREPAQLRFLADELLPEWNRSWPSNRTARIWSAGCAGGQEPYSIAILLRENGWNRPYLITGTDLSEARLAQAREAVFSKWSLRTLSAERAARWFRQDGSRYILDRDVATDVTFAPLNLAASFPHIRQQDVIFCRNVLIYFDIPTITGIAERLLDALAPGGWLFLGASDPHIADLIPCEAVVLPGSTAYRRCNEPVSAYSLRNAPLTLIDPIPDLPPEGQIDEFADAFDSATTPADDDFAAAPTLEAMPGNAELNAVPPAADSAASRVQEIRALANEGLLKQAGIALASALEDFPGSAELHLIESILHAQSGRWSDAERAARRALYIDRSLTLAHVALGDVLARRGDKPAARRNFENAAALISSAEARGDLADSDGVPLARLLHIVRAHLSVLGEPDTAEPMPKRWAS